MRHGVMGWFLAGLIMLAGAVSADVVHLESGGQLEGTVTDLGDSVRVEYNGGVMTVAKAAIKRIEEKAPAAEVFAARLDKLSDADACVKLAEWAGAKNLNDAYVQALRKALLLEPGHEEARKRLREFSLYFSRLPINDAASTRMLADMGPGFNIYRSCHYRICYNTDELFAEITAERLETLYKHFLIYFEDRHFEPAPLTDRLEVVLFNSREAFEAAAERFSPEMALSSGFFANETGRSYFFDSLSENDYEFYKLREKIGRMREENERFRGQVLENRDERVAYVVREEDGTERRMGRSEMLAELDRRDQMLNHQAQELVQMYREQNIRVAIHEGTHQLAYQTGIHNKYIRNPLWLVEGLAMYFEAPEWGEWPGPGKVNGSRLEQFVKNIRSAAPVRLERLIHSDELFKLGGHGATDAYAGAWSLFFYLTNRQHERLFDYIYNLSLKSALAGDYTAEQRRTDFEKYFGRIEEVERAWWTYMVGLKMGD